MRSALKYKFTDYGTHLDIRKSSILGLTAHYLKDTEHR